MSEMDFFKMAWNYATGTLPTDMVDTLWVRVLERSERLDLLLIIGGVKKLWKFESELLDKNTASD